MKSKHEEHALVISAWESEGGAPNRSGQLDQYGRRFDGNGTYSIYHVFTGETAEIGPWKMEGLSPKNAARALCILNTPKRAGDRLHL
ncbi:hypothetical protein [Sinorhizobium sp. Sb3]|jgi:hypothetical protein|uniref:hypothetical protein n=1 Tax=Sinorhizobium/Ensifer group TaxID=227292 RepID=UPI00071D56A4|nr:hypothetical protein [Sinorhizobium sp. Sb3]KSV61793.1 hypothetical protein N183_37020 [Sinorhizobium sp. Sb3]